MFFSPSKLVIFSANGNDKMLAPNDNEVVKPASSHFVDFLMWNFIYKGRASRIHMTSFEKYISKVAQWTFWTCKIYKILANYVLHGKAFKMAHSLLVTAECLFALKDK